MKTNFTSIAVFAMFALIVASCNKRDVVSNEPDPYQTDGELSFSREIVLENGAASTTRAFGTTSTIVGTISGSINTDGTRVLSYTISPNILTELEVSMTEFDDLLREELGDQYLSLAPKIKEHESEIKLYSKDFVGCLNMCTDTYTDSNGKKLSGRGVCRFGCWVQHVFQPFLDKIFSAPTKPYLGGGNFRHVAPIK